MVNDKTPLGLMMDGPALYRLRRLISPWGGKILVRRSFQSVRATQREEYLRQHKQSLYDSPFEDDLVCHYEERWIACLGPVERLPVSSLIHELGHVFACKQLPDDADEWSFLGWEIAVAKRIGLQARHWMLGNSAYEIELGPRNFVNIGRLSDVQFEGMWDERLATAKTLKLVDGEERPLCIR